MGWGGWRRGGKEMEGDWRRVRGVRRIVGDISGWEQVSDVCRSMEWK